MSTDIKSKVLIIETRLGIKRTSSRSQVMTGKSGGILPVESHKNAMAIQAFDLLYLQGMKWSMT